MKETTPFKIYFSFCALILLCVIATALINVSNKNKKEGVSTIIKPSPSSATKLDMLYYLIRTEGYPTIDGGVALMLDYARDGIIQSQAIFNSTEERDAYVKHLETIGIVLNKRILK